MNQSCRWYGLVSACVLALAAQERMDVEEKETIQQTFPTAKTVEVDNLDGSIDVTGASVGEIQLVLHKTIRARSPEKIQEAKKDVRLDVSQQDGALRLYVDGPFRCKCGDGSIHYRGGRSYGYEVSYEFALTVPRETNVRLKTVNHGHVKVEKTTGTFDVDNINGGVELLEVAGSGRAYALNQPLKVRFSRNPQSDSYFGSLNGDVEVAFRPDLSANLRLKTSNGHAYTDFDVTALPGLPPVEERRNGKFLYKSNSFYGVRVAAGGPELKFDAFNGDIRIIRREP